MEDTSLLSSGPSSSQQTKKRRFVVIVVVVVAIILVAVGISAVIGIAAMQDNHDMPQPIPNDPIVCPAANIPLQYKPFYSSAESVQMVGLTSPRTLIRNATVWDGVGNTLTGTDVLFENGKITAVGKDLPTTAATVIEANGRHLTPGLVDMHSHLGDYSFPEDAQGTQDGNEMTNPTFPQLRALDAVNPNDPAIPLIRNGGITTSLVLPGSGNLMGGEAAVVKMRGRSPMEMIIPGAKRSLKMACGENPKRVYGSKDKTPSTRMGNGYGFRKKFFEAAVLKQQQDQWDCVNAKSVQQTVPRPFDLDLEPLVGVLRGQVQLMIHCYKVEDLEMVLRTSQEFSFKVAAFHHGLEAWKIADKIAANNITIATFADKYGFKMEAYDGSVHAPQILTENGAKFAFKSDHPVIFARWLLLEAAKGNHYFDNPQLALESVTSVPAKAIGIFDRVGSIQVGKDADLVLWDRHFLTLGAKPFQLYIEGILYVNNNVTKVQHLESEANVGNFPVKNKPKVEQGAFCNSKQSQGFAMVNAASILANASFVQPGNVVVSATGVIECVGACTVPGNYLSIDASGLTIMPGAVSVGAPLGLVEIEQESNTWDGTFYGDASDVQALDGIRFSNYYGKLLTAAFNGGVLSAVTSPLAPNIVSGLGTAFATQGITVDDAGIKPVTSLHIQVGNQVKGSIGSISAQISTLKKIFAANSSLGVSEALAKTIPVVAHVDHADSIAAVLRLQNTFGFNLIIMGGAEAHLVADSIAAAGASVVLYSRQPPHTFETWHAVTNAPALLRQKGISVALALSDASDVRNLRWEAGYAVTEGMTYADALASITSVPAQMFGLQERGIGSVSVGTSANFVAFNGDPLSLMSSINFLVSKTFVSCNPQQF